ncbi:MAG: ADP-ribose pyrophosphatase YjhB (NUDIX family) [Cellvibrionaceae bacterium]|jgi:ADP-ribose pyrophosphatase YjhB (NUDIX family)
MKFCSICGTSVSWVIPADDNRERHVCDNVSCSAIHYQNPRIITGCLPTLGKRVLLCKRAIEPKYGYWTLPAGFLENGETIEQGALRESWEEAKANLQTTSLYTLFDLPHINQVYFFYKAELADEEFGAGQESLDVRLFTEDEIPWQELAFPVVEETLKYYFEDRKKQEFIFRSQVLSRSHRI